MDRTVVPSAPDFAPAALRRVLAEHAEAHEGDPAAIRAAILKDVKPLLKRAREAARQGLEADGNGRRCAMGLSRFQDELVRLLYDIAAETVFQTSNPLASDHMSLVATGGYGRGMLAPRSDIDLLFLLPYKPTPWSENVVEFILLTLWDMGLKIGHAVRSLDQCIALSKSDMTIRTALLDARLIHGSAALFGALERRFRDEVAAGTGREFVAAKLAERDVRHASAGESRYKVEPNIKDGKGGLRDLHTLHWLAKYLHQAEPGQDAVEAGIFTASEYRSYRRCEDFLWTVRCHMHFAANRAEERLTFDMQPVIAEVLGYGDRGGLRAVERFMKHYFLVAREVGELTLAVCAALEMKQVKPAPIIGRLLSPLSWRTRRGIRRTTDFRVENGRITVTSREVFRQDPVNIIRLFEVAERHAVPFHPEAVRLVRHSLRLIDDKVRQDREANRIFLDLITARSGVENVLRRMNETGVLGRFLPEFGHIVGMMQFNMYHHYTVDEHLIRSVGLLQRIEEGTLQEDHPLATTIIQQVQGRRALYVAQLLHDVGKREAGDHSVNGARIARELCPRLGMTKAETDTVAWLIENHLVMSTFAQSRDLNDPKTIRSFADIVQGPERLRLLLILTVADIRAVGPGVWNGWKGQLLRALYAETEPVLAGGHSGLGRADRVEAAKDALRHELPGWNAASLERLIACHHDDYWLSADTAHHVEQARLMRQAEDAGETFAYAVETNAFTASTELTVLAPNLPRLLAMFAGACAAAGANIMGAQITTTKDERALDVFVLQRTQDEADERRAAARIGETMRKLIEGELQLDRLMEKRRKPPARLSAFHIEPEVAITNALSDRLTVVEIAGLDRPGLLYDVTSALSDLGLDIASAHIATYGERVVDVFYVTSIGGGKIADEKAVEGIRERLLRVFSEGQGDGGPTLGRRAARPGTTASP